LIFKVIIEDIPDNVIDYFKIKLPNLEVILKDNPYVFNLPQKNFAMFSDLNEENNFFVESSKRFNIEFSEMKGKRSEMEDAISIVGNFGSDNRDFVGLFDGHGGTEISTFVANNFHVHLKKELEKGTNPSDIPNRIRDAFKLTQDGCEKILIEKGIIDKKIGSTGVVGLFLEEKIWVANVGDSRSVISRGGKAQRISVDHKPMNQDERIRIRDLGGFVMNNGRVNGILAVARSFGDFFLKPFISSEPHITDAIDITPEDEFVLFCCDGVFDVISDDLAVEIVRKELQEKNEMELNKKLKRAASKLRDIAYLSSSSDNISVIIVLLKKNLLE